MQQAAFHILLALSAGDRHGYAILQDIADRTDNQLRLGPATLYRTLQKMLEEGLILEVSPASEGDDPRRRYYRISASGDAAARAETRRLSELVRMAHDSGFAPAKA